MLRLVHSNRIVGLLYGQRALLIGGTDPRNYVGSNEHTRDRHLPFKRLARTAESFEAVFFGDKATADALLKHVAELHTRVKGELIKEVGGYQAGTHYSAFDPSMMLWTIACIADSALVLFELLVRELTDDEKERLWQDYIYLGELFGMPRSVAPQTYPEFREYFNGRLHGDELALTKSARRVGKQICFNVPVPVIALPLRGIMNIILLGVLPKPIRRMYHLRFGPHQRLGFKITTFILRMNYPITPNVAKKGYDDFFYKAVIGAEQKQFKKGKALSMPDDPYGK